MREKASSTCAVNMPNLQPHLQSVIDERRATGLLGQNILNQPGFDFDIRIQMGAAPISAARKGPSSPPAKGCRANPRRASPYPVTRGYLNCPTVVNNVETFSHVARIMDRGRLFPAPSAQTRATEPNSFSVSGDCRAPGIYRNCPTA